MSVVESTIKTRPHTTAKQRRLSGPEKSAILAAVAAGSTKIQVAQQFGVHPNTVSNICEAVRKFEHPANPLSDSWEKTLLHDSVNAITHALRDSESIQAAGELGVKVMTGLGKFQSGNQVKVEAAANIVVQWGRTTVDHSGEIVDVTPEESSINTGSTT